MLLHPGFLYPYQKDSFLQLVSYSFNNFSNKVSAYSLIQTIDTIVPRIFVTVSKSNPLFSQITKFKITTNVTIPIQALEKSCATSGKHGGVGKGVRKKSLCQIKQGSTVQQIQAKSNDTDPQENHSGQEFTPLRFSDKANIY